MRRSYRGKMVDVERIKREQENTVASGNMKVNAKGDTLGPGGRVIETVQEKTRRKHTSTKKIKKTMSIKDDISKEEDVLESAKKLVKPKRKTPAKKSAPKRKEIQSDDGDIFIEEE